MLAWDPQRVPIGQDSGRLSGRKTREEKSHGHLLEGWGGVGGVGSALSRFSLGHWQGL